MTRMHLDDVKHRLEKLGEIATLPQAVQRVLDTLDRAQASAEDLARAIEKDQVLAAKVLRLANSPFYGLPTRIASLGHAVAVLGMNVVKGLAVGATVFNMIKAAAMDPLWRHSLGVAMTSHILARHIGHKKPEEAFLAGLLHDLGKVVLYANLPDLMEKVEATAHEKDCYMMEAEHEILGLTHADVAGSLAENWRLPSVLKEPIMFHHKPNLATVARQETAIVHVADVLVKGMGCGFSGDDLVPPLSTEAWHTLRLDDHALASCVEEAGLQFERIDNYL